MPDQNDWHIEGKARFQIGNAFYRSHSQLARDLGVLAAKVQRAETGRLRILDAMAGCGVRSLRYYLESQADYLWVNDSNPEIHATLSQNLDLLERDRCRITHIDANRIFFECYNQQSFYDLVDVDAFGSAAPYIGTSLWAVAIGGLLYLTSTDGRSLTGHNSQSGLAAYNAYARSHPAAHEQGLRILIGATQQLAAAKGLGIEPVFSLFAGQGYRVMLRLVSKPQATSHFTTSHYGFLGYCRSCGNYQPIAWRQLGKIACPHDAKSHDAKSLEVSGAMWLGRLHDIDFLERMISAADRPDRVALMRLMQAEAALPPYFYPLGEIGRRGKLDIPKRSILIQTLKDWGYAASTTHVNPQAIKTTATLQTCIEAVRTQH